MHTYQPSWGISTLLHHARPCDVILQLAMDPLTAVGLASNVIQFVGFAGELISKGKEISRNADGALVENLELEAVTDSLLEMSANLISLPSAEPSVSECELLKLCEGSRELAGELLATLQKLKASDSRPRAWKSFRQALNSVLSAEKIEQLSARLERYQRQIHTALLVSLRYCNPRQLEMRLTISLGNNFKTTNTGGTPLLGTWINGCNTL